MSASYKVRPSPAEHKEIARGSGPAAILLFLHIAVTGYLAAVVYLLLKDNVAVFWTLVPFSAGLFYYFPAAFALFTAMPTNPLTKTVARVAQALGVLALLTYGGGLVVQVLHVNDDALNPGIETACAVAAGIAGALLLRVIFRLGIGHPAENAKKTES